MSLNITLAGFVYRSSGSLSNLDVKYQMFFYQNGTASSPDAWNNVRIVENTGYYSTNLGDGDWLGQSGTVLDDSKIVMVFWAGSPLGDDRNADCSILTEWGATEITISGASIYVLDTQVKTNYSPDLIWSLIASGYVDTDYSTTNSSDDIHQWTFGSAEMYHWYQKYGETINTINQVDTTSYWWGDTGSDIDLPSASIGTHQWGAAGYYDVDVVIEDKCSSTSSGTDQIQIFYHAPTGDITMTPSDPDPNQVITFQWTGTDIDNRITSIDWVINDSGAYGNTDTSTSASKNTTVSHSNGLGTDWCGQSGNSGAFTNPGSHSIEITINWNDGFTDQTLDYDEAFAQDRFLGPSVSFTQIPLPAIMSSGTRFVNTSSEKDRVGLGLSACDEYDWRFTDDGVSTNYLDKPFSYELEVTPTSIDCQTRLCADWSDGWDTNQTCTSANIPFAANIVITEQDCYNHLTVYGTSGDGTITGYSWTISSGTSETGPWSEVWSSPVGVDQQEKDIYFCIVDWYKVEAFIYGSGTTTSGSEVLYVSEACPATEAVYNIWNGTGILDLGTDWDHIGDGVEVAYAMHAGTNGLDANLSNTGDFRFSRVGYVLIDIQEYDYLTMWLNIRFWQNNRSIDIKLSSSVDNLGDTLNLEDYSDISTIDSWQKVFIPLVDFNIPVNGVLPGSPIYVNYLRFQSNGNIRFYLDDVKFSMGTTEAVAVCDPELVGDEQGQISMSGEELKPNMSVNVPVEPCGYIVLRPFPRPGE